MSMNIKGLKDRKTEVSPYSINKITIKIIGKSGKWLGYRNAKKQEKEFQRFAVADASDCCIMILYNKRLESVLTVGKTVTVKNFIFREKELRLTTMSTVYAIGKTLEVPNQIREEAEKLMSEDKACITIEVAKQQELKSKVTVFGRITTDEVPRQVMRPNNDQILVREMTLQDKTDKISVSLWQRATEASVKAGDFVQLTNATLSYNNYYNHLFLSINHPADIQLSEPPIETTNVTIEGINSSSDDIMLLAVDEEGNELELSVEKYILLKAMQVKNLEEISQKLPVKKALQLKGNQIIQILTAQKSSVPVAGPASKSSVKVAGPSSK